MTPETIGQYKIERVLGQGAMGIVYLAHDPEIGRTVALKTFSQVPDGDSILWDRFRIEAQAAGRLNHANIVRIFSFGQETLPGQSSKVPYFVMEFVQGRELKQALVERERFPLSRAVHIVGQILNALEHAHAQKVVHRDIKPANVMLLSGDKVKVTDFGVAKLDSKDMTQTGSLVGTPSYMAPEQLTGAPIDARTDLFSVGVVLFELLTGEKPFPGDSATQVMYKVLHSNAPKPSELTNTVPPPFDAVVTRALARDPNNRFQSARDFYETLLAAEQGKLAEAPAGSDTLHKEIRRMSPEVLTRVEHEFTKFVGPMAKILVKKAATLSGTLSELTEHLEKSLDSAADRTSFQKTLSSLKASELASCTPKKSTTTSADMTQAAGAWSPDQSQLQQITSEFSRIVGPVAKVLMKRELPLATSREDFLAKLTKHIENPVEQERFLKMFKK